MATPGRELVLPIIREDNPCLPLAVNAVARYWNVDLPMREAVEISGKYPGVAGSILIEGIELAERHGLGSAVINSSLGGLLEMIDGGIPPIVILPGVRNTVQHASVISGYDGEAGTIMHYIPEAEGDEFKVGIIPQEQFERIWSEDGRLAIILAPADTIAGLRINVANARSNRLCFDSERTSLLGDADRAIDTLQEAIKLDDTNATAHSLLGSIYNGQGSAKCVQYYEKCTGINDRYFLAYRGLGNYHVRSGNYPEAEKFYTNAIRINPARYGPIYKNRAVARMQQGKDARSDLEDYLKYMPGAPDEAAIRQAISEQ